MDERGVICLASGNARRPVPPRISLNLDLLYNNASKYFHMVNERSTLDTNVITLDAYLAHSLPTKLDTVSSGYRSSAARTCGTVTKGKVICSVLSPASYSIGSQARMIRVRL